MRGIESQGDLEKKIQESITRQERVIYHNAVNEHDTLFGGLALKWMDEVAYLSAAKFARTKLLTVSAGPIKFLTTVPYKSFIAIEAKVTHAGNVKLKIGVTLSIIERSTLHQTKAIEGEFIFAAVDDNLKPVRLR